MKYRVWDVENESYDDPYSYAYYAMTQDGGLDFYCHGDHMDNCDPEKYIVEQWTGIVDKNGKEIYEGDIVKDSEDEMYNQVVWFSQVGGFRVAPNRRAVELLKELAPEYLTKGEAVGWFITDDLEVVGNIHENPELLGGEERNKNGK